MTLSFAPLDSIRAGGDTTCGLSYTSMTTVPRKISLKHPEIGQAGGMCRFQNASAPERYRERHEGRLSAKEAHRGHGALLPGQNRTLASHQGKRCTRSKRRLDVHGGVLTTNPLPARAAPLISPCDQRIRIMLSTSITRAFGLATPIVNAGMAMIARPALAAAVCEAGGLGTIGSDINPPHVLRDLIRQTKALTKVVRCRFDRRLRHR